MASTTKTAMARNDDDGDDTNGNNNRMSDPEYLDGVYGTGTRGKVLFGASLLLCLWFFTVPPDEFRRVRICGEAQAAANPVACKTLPQFAKDAFDYYANGGGVRWDFSVGAGTKEYYDNYGR